MTGRSFARNGGCAHRRGSGPGVQLAIPARAVPPLQGTHPGALPVGGAAGRRWRWAAVGGSARPTRWAMGCSAWVAGLLWRSSSMLLQHRADRAETQHLTGSTPRWRLAVLNLLLSLPGGARALSACGVHQRAMLLSAWRSPGAFGGRDIKVNGRCRAVLGWQHTLLAMFLAFWAAGFTACICWPPVRPTKKTPSVL